MRQPGNLPAFCRVHRNGRPLIGMSAPPRRSGLCSRCPRSARSARLIEMVTQASPPCGSAGRRAVITGRRVVGSAASPFPFITREG